MTETKVCYRCGRDLPLTCFRKDGKENGVQIYRPSCKACYAFSDDIRNSRRTLPVDEPDRKCKTCGEVKPATAFLMRSNKKRRAECFTCQAAKARERYHEKMEDPEYRKNLRRRLDANRAKAWYKDILGRKK